MSKLGMLGSFIDQSYPPASKFTEDDVPDLSGKVIIVTGGNTGIGVKLTESFNALEDQLTLPRLFR